MNCKICGAQYREGEECPNAVNHEGLKPQDNSYGAMRKDELIALAESRGIELSGDETKADLIARLEETEAQNQA